jgi:hypothetical protein
MEEGWLSERWTYEIMGGNLYRLTSGDRRTFLESHRGHIEWLLGDFFWIEPEHMAERHRTYSTITEAA